MLVIRGIVGSVGGGSRSIDIRPSESGREAKAPKSLKYASTYFRPLILDQT